MRTLLPFLLLVSSPALAHHEVIVATSIIPAMTGLAFVLVTGVVVARRKWREVTGGKHANDATGSKRTVVQD